MIRLNSSTDLCLSVSSVDRDDSSPQNLVNQFRSISAINRSESFSEEKKWMRGPLFQLEPEVRTREVSEY